MTIGKGESSSVSFESKIVFRSLHLPLRLRHATCPSAPRGTELSALSSPGISSPPANPTSQATSLSSFGTWAHTILSWKAAPLSLLSEMFVKWKTNALPKSYPLYAILRYGSMRNLRKYIHTVSSFIAQLLTKIQEVLVFSHFESVYSQEYRTHTPYLSLRDGRKKGRKKRS